MPVLVWRSSQVLVTCCMEHFACLPAEPDMAETSDGEADEKLPPASSEGLKSRDTSDVVAKAMRNAIQQVDDLILRKEKKEAEETGGYGGSTAIVALRIAEVCMMYIRRGLAWPLARETGSQCA